MDHIIVAMLDDINYTWSILTNVNSYGIMDQEVLYLFGGIFSVFILGGIGYFKALNQSPVKYKWRRSWVKQ